MTGLPGPNTDVQTDAHAGAHPLARTQTKGSP
jgi:hypothetical protein